MPRIPPPSIESTCICFFSVVKVPAMSPNLDESVGDERAESPEKTSAGTPDPLLLKDLLNKTYLKNFVNEVAGLVLRNL